MTSKTLAALVLSAAMGVTAGNGAAADDPKLPDAKAFDKTVIDTLRDVHNKGADLYNASKDFVGAFRVYQGALVTIRPLLTHRPNAQAIIDTGLAAADKEGDIARKAFVLHETIESVRKTLKIAIGEGKPDEPKTPEVKKPEEMKKPEEAKKPETKKPEEMKKPETKKPDETKKPTEPMPKEVKPKDAGAVVSGKVMLAGKPLAAGDVTFVSLDQKTPKVFTAAVKADGTFKVADAVPPGKYAGLVTGAGVPDKYTLANTSGLTFEFAAGPNSTDLDLKK